MLRTLISTAFLTAISSAATADCSNIFKETRVNPSDLSAHQLCILDNYHTETQTGKLGNHIWMRYAPSSYVSIPANSVNLNSEETIISHLQQLAEDKINQQLEEEAAEVKAAIQLNLTQVRSDILQLQGLALILGGLDDQQKLQLLDLLDEEAALTQALLAL